MSNLLELVSGVLFAPKETFRRLAVDPPLGMTFIVVTILNAATVVMGLLTLTLVPRDVFGPAGAGLSVGIALGSFVLYYVKWLGYGAVLNLLAQLLGGHGHARATLVAYGLAGLPGLFMFPIQSLTFLVGESTLSVLSGLVSLGLFIWSLVLLVIGIREMHAIETGRAVFVVFIPGVVLVGLLLVFTILLAVGIVSLIPNLPVMPGSY